MGALWGKRRVCLTFGLRGGSCWGRGGFEELRAAVGIEVVLGGSCGGYVRIELCVIAAGDNRVTLGVQGEGTMTEVPTI